MFFFKGGVNLPIIIILGIYSWDHDMYLIDSPWFCWVSVRFCIGFGWISEMFCIGSAWIRVGFC